MRNDVWHTEESLWHDVTLKSPNNGRGWSNYGGAFVTKQDFAGALPLLIRAQRFLPYDSVIQVNLGTTYDGLGNDVEAQRHAETAIGLNPRAFFVRYLLLKIYSQQKNRPAFDNLMQDSLRLAYNDE